MVYRSTETVPNELPDFLRSPHRIVKVSFHFSYDKVWEEGETLKKELFNFKAKFKGNLEGLGLKNFVTFHFSVQ